MLASLLRSIDVLDGLVSRNSAAVVAVLSRTVRRARDEVRVLNASGDAAQLLFATS